MVAPPTKTTSPSTRGPSAAAADSSISIVAALMQLGPSDARQAPSRPDSFPERRRCGLRRREPEVRAAADRGGRHPAPAGPRVSAPSLGPFRREAARRGDFHRAGQAAPTAAERPTRSEVPVPLLPTRAGRRTAPHAPRPPREKRVRPHDGCGESLSEPAARNDIRRREPGRWGSRRSPGPRLPGSPSSGRASSRPASGSGCRSRRS